MTGAPGPRPVTLDAVAAAEAVAGVAYTEDERRLMLDGVQAQVELALRRRLVGLPWDLGPATRFDPRLPGFALPEPGAFRWEPADVPLPEDEESIAFAPLAALAGWIRAGRLRAARLTRLYLDRIARHDPRLLCFARVLPELALAEAEGADARLARGEWLGPLHGIPYGLKDILDTAGVETDWGAETHRGRVPDRDSFVAEALRRAGAVLLGKTSVGALAYGDLWHGGRTRNPWNPAEGSSGSSAGSASAVAAGLAGFAIGTETLGSIVAPCARCGAAGLRPTHGRVSRRGAMPLCWSLDKVGVIGRHAEDTLPVLAAIGGPDPADPFQVPAPLGYDPALPLGGLRLGWFEEDFAAGGDTPERTALDAARGLGMRPVPLRRRPLPYDSLRAVVTAEAAASFEELTLGGRDDELAWQEADAWPTSFRRARFLSAVDHVQLDRLRRLVMQEMAEAFRGVDLVLGPALAGPMTLITNFTGHPCLTLRAGFRQSSARGRLSPGPAASAGPLARVPAAVSLWGRLFDEGRLVAAGRALEAALGAAKERPAL